MTDPNPDFDQLAAITIAHYSNELSDNVTNNIPVLMLLKKMGNLDTDEVSGGTTILENLRYAENASFKWFNGYEELSVTPTNDFSAASFDWKECNANVIFSGREVAINSGSEEKQFDLIKGKTQSTEDTLMNNLGAALFYSNTENDGKSIGGFQHLVADDPTSGTVGGINRATSTNAFWRNQIYDFSVEGVTASSGTMRSAMNTLYRRCQRNSDVPDLIIFGNDYHDFYETFIQAQQVFNEANQADIGFPYGLYKKKSKVIYDPNCSDTRGYFLNLKFIKLRAHKMVNMKAGKPKHPTNQNATVIPLNWMGNMTVANASLQGVMHA